MTLLIITIFLLIGASLVNKYTPMSKQGFFILYIAILETHQFLN